MLRVIRTSTALTSLFMFGWPVLVCASEPQSDSAVQALLTDSRAPYVHRITLYDHDGTAIDPTDEFAGPYSPRMTCGKCHDYATISCGWHFNEALKSVPGGRPGEPWILLDPETGAQVPVSGRGWPGTYAPQEAELTNWQFVLKWGAYTPGGAYGQPSDEVVQQSGERLRWGISGKLEIDCMFCHSADQQHDPAEAARQIEQENFKWSPTAALGLAIVRGQARKLPDDWDPLMPVNPSVPAETGPEPIWDQTRFDADDRVFFNIPHQPPAERCYFCHSFREVGSAAPARWQMSRDVHLAAGLTCADCHGHGLDHMMIRGYPEEAAERGDPSLAAFSCEGCHLGVEGADDRALALGGRYGAPHPQHRGLPPLHFEKLACTACHSGPWPEMSAGRFQTSLAHGLGLATRERSADTPPYVYGPVFGRSDDGKVVPSRLIETARGTYLWPLAHDVRPAAQSLGVDDCTDCHDDRGVIFVGEVVLRDGVHRMLEFHGYNSALASGWSWGFTFRPALRYFGLICAGAIAVVLLRFLLGSHSVVPGIAETAQRRRLSGLQGSLLVVGGAGILVGAATGLGAKWIYGTVAGWLLFVHMLGAPLFVLGLTGLALLWADRCRFSPAASGSAGGLTLAQRVLFWFGLVTGWTVMISMLAAMLPVFGYAGQEMLINIHYVSTLLLVIAVVLYVFVSLGARRAKR